MQEPSDKERGELPDCSREYMADLENELQTVTDLIDDILYDPSFYPVDEQGKPIHGNLLYMLDHPVQERHMPALRDWFISRQQE